MKKVIWYLVIVFVGVLACKKSEVIPDKLIVNGFLLKTDIITYGYGTHILMKDKNSNITNYALRSANIKLDDFVNQQVKIIGNTINGYPVDGGPIYLEVLSIQKE